MVSARVSWQQGFEKNNSKIRSYPPDSELHVCTLFCTEKKTTCYFVYGTLLCWYIQKLWRDGRDAWYHEVMRDASPQCEPVWLEAEDHLFMLYTSGSTGENN